MVVQWGLSGQQRQPSASHGLPSGIAKARGNSSYMLPFYLTIQPINIPMDTTCASTFSLVWKLVPFTMYRYCASSLTKYGWKMKGQGDHLVPSAIGWQDWQLGVVSASDGEIKYREGKCSWPLHFPRQCNPMPPTASSLGLRGELQKLEVQKLNLTHANKDGNGRGFVPPYHRSGWRGFTESFDFISTNKTTLQLCSGQSEFGSLLNCQSGGKWCKSNFAIKPLMWSWNTLDESELLLNCLIRWVNHIFHNSQYDILIPHCY